jgi:hypothetical protein
MLGYTIDDLDEMIRSLSYPRSQYLVLRLGFMLV